MKRRNENMRRYIHEQCIKPVDLDTEVGSAPVDYQALITEALIRETIRTDFLNPDSNVIQFPERPEEPPRLIA